LLIAVFGLIGCVQSGQTEPRSDTCRSADYTDFIGEPIAVTTLTESARIVGPDAFVTEDFAPSRLNVLVTADGTITGFRCG
jgi:hypothetical protein